MTTFSLIKKIIESYPFSRRQPWGENLIDLTKCGKKIVSFENICPEGAYLTFRDFEENRLCICFCKNRHKGCQGDDKAYKKISVEILLR